VVIDWHPYHIFTFRRPCNPLGRFLSDEHVWYEVFQIEQPSEVWFLQNAGLDGESWTSGTMENTRLKGVGRHQTPQAAFADCDGLARLQ
jgi:hypothetical protein